MIMSYVIGKDTTTHHHTHHPLPKEGSRHKMEHSTLSSETNEQGLLEKYHRMTHVTHQVTQEYIHLSLLHQLSQKLHHILDLPDLLNESLQSMMAITEAQDGWIALLNEEHGLERFGTYSGPNELEKQNEQETVAEEHIQEALSNTYYRDMLDDEHHHVVFIPNINQTDIPTLIPGHAALLLSAPTDLGISVVMTLIYQKPYSSKNVNEGLLSSAMDIVGTAIQHVWRYIRAQERDLAREQMINVLVHDIRSPLMSTSASMEVVKRMVKGLGLDDTSKQFLDESLDSGKRGLNEAVDLADELLTIKKLQSGNRQVELTTTPIERLYDDLDELLRPLALQRKVMVRYHVEPRSLTINADRRLLWRAVMNLIANALRFTPGKGVVTVRSKASPDEDGVIFSVEDMGPGVAPEDRERIFDPFIQAKGEYRRGSGLGLAFCREVAQVHHGRIWVEDREGGGSRFCIFLPHREKPHHADEADEANEAEMAHE